MDLDSFVLGALCGGAASALWLARPRSGSTSVAAPSAGEAPESAAQAELAAERAERAAALASQEAERAAAQVERVERVAAQIERVERAAARVEHVEGVAAQVEQASARLERVRAGTGGAGAPGSGEASAGRVEPAPPQASPPASPEPELRLVAYGCPQCGASVEIPSFEASVRCGYCEAAIRIEGRRAAPRRAGAPRSAEPLWEPPRSATLNSYEFGRFELCLLRQTFAAEPREAMRWLPLDERHAGLVVLRVVREEGGRRVPCGEPALLEALSSAACERLQARRDPGLAVKAALQALGQSGASGRLEAFAAVFDGELSRVVACNAGCTSALIHCSLEEARPIDVSRAGQPLDPIALRGKQDPFSNERPLELAADDAVLALSAAFGGEGQGWPQGPGSTFRTLREGFAGKSASELARAVHEAFWTERSSGSRGREAPVGDLLVAAIRVRSNAELASGAELAGEPLARLELASATFGLTLALPPAARTAWRELHGPRRVLVALDPLPPAAAGEELLTRFLAPVLTLLDGQTGDNDNARRAGRAGLTALGEPEGLRALVLYLHDEHGKVAFWTRGWPAPCALLRRGERSASYQAFDQGGELWLRAAGRALFFGDLPLSGPAPLREDEIPAAWGGGKASALFDLCRQQEDHETSAEFFAALAQAVAIDVPQARQDALGGALVLTRLREP